MKQCNGPIPALNTDPVPNARKCFKEIYAEYKIRILQNFQEH
jgi:hypothetical protein